MWHIMRGLHDSVELSFMRVGHTRCTVDAYFGRLKKTFRESDVDTMQQLCDVVNNSCQANVAKPYDWEWKQWDSHLAKFLHQ